MVLSDNDKMLFTAGDDGSLIIYEIRDNQI
jgi:hypothetical protein